MVYFVSYFLYNSHFAQGSHPRTGRQGKRHGSFITQSRPVEKGGGQLKLVLFSDLHLDISFTWMEPRVARRRRQALRDTLVRIIDLAIAERADALLCGGDLYEQDRFTPDTGEFLRGAFERLHPMPVLLAPGNHDWWGEESLYRRVGWSPNVHVFERVRLRPFELADGFTVWGGAHQAPANTDDFLTRFSVDRGGVNVALFHGSERVWFTQQEQPKQPHAPFDAFEIEQAGLHHAFLGHFHRPKNAERFTYPGNPDPLSFGEDGLRGAVVAMIGPDGTGDLNALAPHIDGLQVRLGTVHVAYDFEAVAQERTVRGQFVRDALNSGLSADEQRRVLATGLRALDGREDLEAP